MLELPKSLRKDYPASPGSIGLKGAPGTAAAEQQKEDWELSGADIRNRLYEFYFKIIPPFSINLK
ncbi:MAG: hypothetical protein Q8O00_07980, partial [Holophaga sp.]|nr:hypothetical protein [Holophaga sp.]